MAKSRTEQVLQIVGEAGVLRPRDLDPYGIPRQYLRILHDRGLVVRVGRGLYLASDADFTESHALALACKRMPDGVVCLLSALRFHELTTQSPYQVWMAVGSRTVFSKKHAVGMRIVRFSGKALTSGIEEHEIEGVTVKVYNPAKTVVDCFKYRNKIGLDVALKALRDCWRQRRATMDELWRYAKICRMTNVMRPYLESLT